MAKTLEWTKDGDRVWIAHANGNTYPIVASTIRATGEVIYGLGSYTLGIYGPGYDDDHEDHDISHHATLEAAVMRAEEVAAANLEEAKTKVVSQALDKLVGNSTALVVLPQKDQSYNTAMRSMKNLDDAKVLLAGYLNIRDLFSYDKLVMPVATLDALVATLG